MGTLYFEFGVHMKSFAYQSRWLKFECSTHRSNNFASEKFTAKSIGVNPHPFYGRKPLGTKCMATKVAGLIKLALDAGKANPAPPVGPALGAKGVNIMAFCKGITPKLHKSS